MLAACRVIVVVIIALHVHTWAGQASQPVRGRLYRKLWAALRSWLWSTRATRILVAGALLLTHRLSPGEKKAHKKLIHFENCICTFTNMYSHLRPFPLYGYSGCIHTPPMPIHKNNFGELISAQIQENIFGELIMYGFSCQGLLILPEKKGT